MSGNPSVTLVRKTDIVNISIARNLSCRFGRRAHWPLQSSHGQQVPVWLVYELKLVEWRALKVVNAEHSGKDWDLKFLNITTAKGITPQHIGARRIPSF